MKIVMCYSVYGGDECGSYDNTLCFNYESAEAFYCDFEEAWKEVFDKRTEYIEKTREWSRNRPRPEKQNNDLMQSWYKKQPEFASDEFTFCGHTFSCEVFTCEGSFDPPEIYELEEWFDKYAEN